MRITWRGLELPTRVERDNKMASDRYGKFLVEPFERRVRDLRPLIDRIGVSSFEALTPIAALHFRDAGVEAAVYEVGLGGRLDATNILEPGVAVITSIAHDHGDILGRT